MAQPGQYHVNKCLFAKMLKELEEKCGCIGHWDTMEPDDEDICTPAHLYNCAFWGFQGMAEIPGAESSGNGKDKDDVVRRRHLCKIWIKLFQINSAHVQKKELFILASKKSRSFFGSAKTEKSKTYYCIEECFTKRGMSCISMQACKCEYT